MVLMGSDQATTTLVATGTPAGGSYTWSIGPHLAFDGSNTAPNVTVVGTSGSTSWRDTWVAVAYTFSSTATANASVRATVRVPTVLNDISYPGGSTDTRVVTGVNSGYLTTLAYSVYDQGDLGNGNIEVAGINATEVLQTVSNPFNVDFDPADNIPRNNPTNDSGAVWDQLSATLAGGLPANFSASRTQSWTLSGFALTPQNTQTYGPTYATVSNQTFSH